jgi:hypothetical protein
MKWLILSVILGTSGNLDPRFGVVREHVDVVELNHFYDKRGNHLYDQVLFWERLPGSGDFRIRGWTLIDDREAVSRAPTKDAKTGLYEVTWINEEGVRKLHSRIYVESWTHRDPERDDKRYLAEAYRLSLVKPKTNGNP